MATTLLQIVGLMGEDAPKMKTLLKQYLTIISMTIKMNIFLSILFYSILFSFLYFAPAAKFNLREVNFKTLELASTIKRRKRK